MLRRSMGTSALDEVANLELQAFEQLRLALQLAL
jgi:hypothetical protein